MLDKLKQPYPLIERSKIWIQSLFIANFVFLFLMIFRPFGLNQTSWELLLKVTLVYGLISFLVCFLFAHFVQLAFPKVANEDNWTIGKEVIYIVCIIILIAVANYFFTVYMNFTPFSLYGFIWMFISTVGIGFLVVTGIVAIEANRALKKHLSAAQQMNDKIGAPVSVHPMKFGDDAAHKIYLPSEVEKQSLEIEADRLIYLASEANYIACYFQGENGAVQCSKIRNRMKVVDPLLKANAQFFRCHRAFIVNMDYVENVKGNAKGYILSLRGIDLGIPVARSKSSDLKLILK